METEVMLVLLFALKQGLLFCWPFLLLRFAVLWLVQDSNFVLGVRV